MKEQDSTERSMSFEEFFNPYSAECMKAYEHLCNVGFWPEGFIPDSVKVPVGFVTQIQAKMAQAWLKATKDELLQEFLLF